MKFVDLTMSLGTNTPVYPGDPRVGLKSVATVGTDGYQDTVLTMDTHNGTHIDAPAHMLERGKTLDQFGIDSFTGQGVLVDAREGLRQESFQEIGEGRIVLLWTGFSDDYTSTDYYHKLPKFEDGAVDALLKQRPTLVGVDAGSLDGEPFSVHKAMLRAGILIAENLVGLSILAGKEFEVFALPLKLDVDGSPARVIAKIG